MNLNNRYWFQLVSRLWRPFQQWGFAIAAVAYAFRPLFDWSFQVETFAALAAAGGVGFMTRALETTAKERNARKYSEVDDPDGDAA